MGGHASGSKREFHTTHLNEHYPCAKGAITNKLIVCFRMVFPRGSNADRHGLIAKAVGDSGDATVQELAELTAPRR